MVQKNTLPPVEFNILLESQVTNTEIKNEILKLQARKMSGEELEQEPRNEVLNDYLIEKIEFYTEYLKSLKQISKPNTDLLNNLFLKTMVEAWKD